MSKETTTEEKFKVKKLGWMALTIHKTTGNQTRAYISQGKPMPLTKTKQEALDNLAAHYKGDDSYYFNAEECNVSVPDQTIAAKEKNSEEE